MSPLDLKRKEMELTRVSCGRQEMELKIEEKLEEVENLRTHLKLQIEAESKLKEELNTLKGSK